MSRHTSNVLSGIIYVVVLGSAGGCADDGGQQDDGDCIFVYDAEQECEQPDSHDEVGDGDGDAPREPSCAAEADGFERTVFQCNGKLLATINFRVGLKDCPALFGNAKWCRESHEFGFGIEPYEMPAVMACCDSEGVPEKEILVHCAADMVDQVCRSIPMRLQRIIDGEALKGKEGAQKQARALKRWLESHRQECREAFLSHAPTPGALSKASFKVPNDLKWSLINDFTITLSEAAVESASLPNDPAEQLPCSDAHFNDTEVFETKLPIAAGHWVEAPLFDRGGQRLAGTLSWTDADVAIHSSLRIGGLPVAATAPAESLSSACQQPRCSAIELTEHVGPGQLTLEELALFADGGVVINHGRLPVQLDDAALRLYGASTAELMRIQNGPGRVYMIAPNGAHFVISGSLADRRDVRWAVNITWMFITVDVDQIRILDFSVQHVDGSGETWTIHVPETRWK